MSDRRVRQLSEVTTTDWTSPELVFEGNGHEELPFSPTEYEKRQARILERLDALSVDALITLRPANIEYCTGFQTVETAPMPLVLIPDCTVLVVPAAEVGRALRSASLDEIASVSPYDDLLAATVRTIAQRLRPDARVGIAADAPTLHAALEAVGLVPVVVGPVVERERLVLSSAERQYVRRAAASTARGLPAALASATVNSHGVVRDSDIAAAVQQALITSSNSLSAFPVVVATGARAGIPHSTWCGTTVEPHQPIFMEYSGAWYRYHAPVMRTISVGQPSDRRLVRLRQLVDTTIATVEETLRPGIPAADVAKAAEDALGALEPWVVFHHNFGYPVGLGHPPTWLDSPQWSLVETNHEPVLEGTVYHVPAVFRAPGAGGVGHSHSYIVTATGCERVTPPDPTISVI